MRFKTREVCIGDFPLGSGYPVRIQSMTNTDTLNTRATVEQSIRMIKAGCEYVRITAPSIQAANNLKHIRQEIRKAGFKTPLIADIHFNPKAAEVAARLVEKVRINPGNYADKKNQGSFSEKGYGHELERIAERLRPLLRICKEYGTAIRIGVNHGSLSERILYRFGDTPDGMVVSALEFASLCRDEGFNQLVLSLKSSQTRVMIEANRLLVDRMQQEGMDFPLHLGVTEAGDAEDGRIKSAAGIGTLLKEGIGDTIRVSLTEDPEYEIPVARSIVDYASGEKDHSRPKKYYLRNHKPLNYPIVVAGEKNEKADLIVTDAGKKGKDAFHLSPVEEDLPEGSHQQPIILKHTYPGISREGFLVRASMDYAPELLSGSCQGLWIEPSDTVSPDQAVQTALDILQATGLRISKTEYIACPSCGRTLFNIQDVLKQVKARTQHLKGLKIAVMGCIVNGPGEMADAHYGYVGSARGKVNLYQGKVVKKKNIPEDQALDQLVQLIRENGDWKE